MNGGYAKTDGFGIAAISYVTFDCCRENKGEENGISMLKDGIPGGVEILDKYGILLYNYR